MYKTVYFLQGSTHSESCSGNNPRTPNHYFQLQKYLRKNERK